MNQKRNVLTTTISFLVLTTTLIFGTYYYFLNKQENLLNSIYQTTNTNILKLTQSFLDNKKSTILSIALALSKDNELYKITMKN